MRNGVEEFAGVFEESGRRGTRTPDIFGVNEALYRLSYPPSLFYVSVRSITDRKLLSQLFGTQHYNQWCWF
jgi:hypothetical protein